MGRRVRHPSGRTETAAYIGTVVHKRARPRRHVLRYHVFSILFDLDRLDALSARLRLFSVGRRNLFALYPKDFGPRDGSDLAAFARGRARENGVVAEIASVRMLAYPRILGYAFNPLTVYFLYDAGGRVAMVIYEVRNTFGEHHFYEHVPEVPAAEGIEHAAPKAFYVSPFNTLEGQYRFSLRLPDDDVFTGITLSNAEGGVLTAYFEGRRAPLSDAKLVRLALVFPLMTFKVIAGIHWEALKLWLKGVPLTLQFRKKIDKTTGPHEPQVKVHE